MKVCIVRNAESESNSDVIRSVDAFTNLGINCMLLTRTRSHKASKDKVIKKIFKYKNKEIENFEIQLYSEMDRGIKNLYQLIMYKFFVFKWLVSNRKKYDVIHAYDLDAGFPSIMAKFLLGKKVVYHISDLFVESRGGIPHSIEKIVRKLEYFVINKAESTIICTEQRIEQIKGSKPKELFILHNSPVECCDIKKKINQNKLIKIGYVGGLIDIRFIKELLEVISNNKEFILEIGGIGPMSDVVNDYSKKYDNIIYHGKLTYDEALKLYNECDLIVAIYDPRVKNHKYSAPNKVYEAMMLGKPIIVAKDTGVDKIVEKEKIGITIDYSKNDFQKSLDNIITNKALLEELSRNSKDSYNKYSWENMILKYKEIYDKL